MLSYQHGFHAGNLADVHKHALLAWMLDYMTQKAKPLTYLETHAGRAVYDLTNAQAQKTGEATQGIGRVRGWFKPDHPYARVLDQYPATHYPGSPMIAAKLLRPDDHITLSELHPQEAEALRDAMLETQAYVAQADGFGSVLSRTPPDPRRGMLLVDPSFEIKDDYVTIPDFLAKVHRKWPVGVLVLWYPILVSGAHNGMVRALRTTFPDALSHQVTFPPAREGHGMIGSGLFVVNPPYGIDTEAGFLSGKFRSL